MSRGGDKTKPLGHSNLPKIDKIPSKFTARGGSVRRTTMLSPRQIDDIWKGAGIKKKKPT